MFKRQDVFKEIQLKMYVNILKGCLRKKVLIFFTLDLSGKVTWAIFGVDVTNFGSTSGENRGLKLLSERRAA